MNNPIRLIVGGLLIYWGVSWFSKNSSLADFTAMIEWTKVWPVILIFVGLSMFSWSGIKGLVIGSAVTILTVVLIISIMFGGAKRQINWPCFDAIREQSENKSELMREERLVTGYDKVKLRGAGKLIIEQNGEEGLVIEADKRMIGKIKTEVLSNELIISYDNNDWWDIIRWSYRGMVYRLSVKDIRQIEIDGAAKIEAKGLKTDNLLIRVDGAGSGEIEGEFRVIEGQINGAGNLELFGSADEQKVNLKGAANWKGGDLLTKRSEVTISGAAKAIVNVSELLKVKLEGAGSVDYRGDAEVEKDITGIGKVEKVD